MNPFVGIVLALAIYGAVVWIILGILAFCAEAGERFDQTIADHYQDKDQT